MVEDNVYSLEKLPEKLTNEVLLIRIGSFGASKVLEIRRIYCDTQ